MRSQLSRKYPRLPDNPSDVMNTSFSVWNVNIHVLWALPDTACGGRREDTDPTLRTKSGLAKSSGAILWRIFNGTLLSEYA